MFRLDPMTGDWTWMPKSMCFFDGEREGGGGGDGGSSGSEGGGGEGDAGSEGGGSADAGGGASGGGGSDGDGNSGGGSDAAGGSGGAGDADGDGSGHWARSIENEDIRKYAERFTDPASLAEQAFKHRQDLSRSIKPINQESTDDELAAFRVAVGAPNEAKEYALPEEVVVSEETPENILQFHEGMKAVAHNIALSPWQFEQLASAYNQIEVADRTKREEAQLKATTNGIESLKEKWGNNYAPYTQGAENAALTFGGEEFLDWLKTAEVEGVKVGNHPQFISAFAKIGRLMNEDSIGSFPGMAESQQEIDTQVKELNRQIFDSQDPRERQELQNKIDALLAKDPANNAPLVGAGGRTA